MVIFDIEKLALIDHISYSLANVMFFILNFYFILKILPGSSSVNKKKKERKKKKTIISVSIYNEGAGKLFWPILIFQLMKLFMLFQCTRFWRTDYIPIISDSRILKEAYLSKLVMCT